MSARCAAHPLRAHPRVLGWLIGLSLLSAPVAIAHPQFGPATVNRYARLVLTAPDRARLFYTVMVGDIPALRLRQDADADHNGHLDPAEQAALQAKLAAQVQGGLSLQAGGGPIVLSWESSQLVLGDLAVSARAFSFDVMAVTQPATAPFGALHYEDQVPLSPVGEVELRVEEAPAVWLRESRGPTLAEARSSPEGQAKGEPLRLFQTYGTPSSAAGFAVDLQVAASESPGPPAAIAPPRRWPVPLLWLAGGGLLGGLILGVARRVARRRS
ncbi:MAG TPA: hypothetical protein PKI03_29605 [Pseudomonadota bacterium]|nr:hypothetical protein [Pseudomonadota bacterium]